MSHVLHANERKERVNKLGVAGVRRLPRVVRKCCWWWRRRLAAAVIRCARNGWRCQMAVLPFLCSVFFFLCFFSFLFLSPTLSLLPFFFFLFDDGSRWSCCDGNGEEHKWRSRDTMVMTTSAAIFLLLVLKQGEEDGSYCAVPPSSLQRYQPLCFHFYYCFFFFFSVFLLYSVLFFPSITALLLSSL